MSSCSATVDRSRHNQEVVGSNFVGFWAYLFSNTLPKEINNDWLWIITCASYAPTQGSIFLGMFRLYLLLGISLSRASLGAD